ncbi:MAG: pirin family protein [Acidimicrobiia bacterium]|nr:pirin family protein [Acidimicrobiia bacterium]MDH3471244.1 pirin family protein [Acidimicrobiia bacterium]
MTATNEQRELAGVLDGVRTLEGEGFLVRRPFPNARLDHLGPFLLLDEMGPSDNAPGEAKGAPDHPHRGFETVTYLIDGAIEHKDSIGGGGVIAPGEVQWMTAGSGIIHSEMPTQEILTDGGRVHGFQLWVNLPASAKWHKPRYQDLTGSQLPTIDLDGAKAVLIAGEAFGVKGAADTFLPITYMHLSVDPESETVLELERDQVAFVYAFRGDGDITAAREPFLEGQMAVFDQGGGKIRIGAGTDGLEAIVGSAEPLNEPVARYGPFVMNTREEIVQAFDDFHAGRLGQIEPERF